MATAPLLEVANDANAIVVAVQKTPGIVLLDTEKFDVFYEKLKAEAPTDADISTKKGRDVLRSYAADVRAKKAAIDKARLQLTKEWRDMTSQANAAGKMIEERLEGLAVEVRAPLTEWEKAEEDRVKFCREVIDSFKRAGVVTLDDTAETVRNRGAELWAQTMEPDTFGDLLDEAQAVKDASVATLKTALARLVREEEERAELERLRAEAAERERADAERREAEEAERQRQAEAAAAEERRLASEKADSDRIAQAERDAADKARREAEEESERKLATERQAREAAEAEAKRLADEQAGREKAEAERIAAEQAEQAARDENKAHRTAVKTAVKQALMTCGADEETARKIVLALQAGEIPNVTLRF